MKTHLKVKGEKPTRHAASDCGLWTVDCLSRRSGAKTDGLGQRGIALVITLIMLSIITFMAITFLILSQRERNSTTTATDQKQALMAADTGLNRALAELTAQMLLSNNFQNMSFMVSTSFVNYAGINPIGSSIPWATNVNYDYEINGQPYPSGLPGNIVLQRNIANLLLNPRAPVYIVTNNGTGQGEFRFYVDLNRNGHFDRSGTWPEVVLDNLGNPSWLSTNASGQFITEPTNYTGWVVSNTVVGDPEWIGILERPREFHSSDNKFTSRYAYMVVPVGNTLDINYIHNRAKRPGNTTTEGFLRNQGAGTWEINLAGFLADLNTNIWYTNNGFSQYNYNTNTPFRPSTGWAFSNANDLLTYRYSSPGGYTTLTPANAVLSNNALPLASAGIDVYSQGPLMLGTSNNAVPENVGLHWPGSDNTNHFFSIQDFFDPTKAGPTFPTFLQTLGTSNDSYNAYTYYRMLAQLGTDSQPEHTKMNINYKNIDSTNGYVVPGMETNLIPWTPADFFTNAADRMFRQLNLKDFMGNLITVTNIPIYEDPTQYGGKNINYYTPAVHRVLQLAANMYDATTSRFQGGGPTNYPSVFSPVFRSLNGVASIVGYQEVSNTAPAFFQYLEVTNFIKTQPQLNNANINIVGVPWVIGVKKGFPNFNAFATYNDISVTRKLAFTNLQGTAKPPWQTNQLYEFGITNSFGVESWNSYTNTYGRPLRLIVSNFITLTIVTNLYGNPPGTQVSVVQAFGNNVLFTPPTGWPGWAHRDFNLPDQSFQVPLYALNNYTNANYLNTGVVVPIAPSQWTTSVLPRMWLTYSFELRYVLIDTLAGRVVDFVNQVGTESPLDMTVWLGTYDQNKESVDALGTSPATGAIWSTNFTHGTLNGVISQIEADYNFTHPGDNGLGGNPPSATAPNYGAYQAFLSNMGGNTGVKYFEDWYHPPATIFQSTIWRANDPLVHYMQTDMNTAATNNDTEAAKYSGLFQVVPNPPLDIRTNLSFSYQPWGGVHEPGGQSQQNGNPYDFDYRVKDPMVQQSDSWDFPTNKFWNVGILGRVHRGTPWQTVYMKPFDLGTQKWTNWNNDNVGYTNANSVQADGQFSRPDQDYSLFDLFTSTMNENATRGQLNVNQTNLAAWSAVLSGVNVLTNDPANGLVPMTILPAGIYSNATPNTPVAQIWQGINNTRSGTNLATGAPFANHEFQQEGDILQTPQLTVASPFLNTNGLSSLTAGGVNDEVMERIPQQIMSLLTLNQTPRFVIYSYGQTLHPADHSPLVVGGIYNGLCTNYQVTAETATRAVVRVEGSPDPNNTNGIPPSLGNPDKYGRYYPPHIVVEQFNVLPPD